ncbi:MAG: palmitoyltransferase swf1 [Alyxoria varia]|nr:MAG: palmitoyltransferase swf1 [Alyxoria varia]
MTTNETAKWGALRDEMFDGYVWKGKKSVLIGHEPGATQQYDPDSALTTGDWLVVDLASDSSHLRDWPVEVDQIVLRTNDGKPPYFPHQTKLAVPGSEDHNAWERCYHLGQVDNMYDLGFLDNLGDVLFPNWRYVYK